MKKYRSLLLFISFLLSLFPVSAQEQVQTLQQGLKQALRRGKYDEAISMLENNISIISNDTTNGLFDSLIDLYLFEKKWNKIIKAWSFHTNRKGEDTTAIELARFYSQFGEEKISLKQTVSIPFKKSLSGSPLIEVTVNGKKYHFWFDTGADISVLSSAIASKCKVKSVKSNAAIATAATGKEVVVNPGIIDSLEINNLKVYNHPCIILNKKDLEFYVLGLRLIKIDGIIGWNLLQDLDVTIDNKIKIITLGPLENIKEQGNNFFWSGRPFIVCADLKEDSLLFFIDTGANQGGLYESYLFKIDTTRLKKKTSTLGSAGGFKKIKSFEVPWLELNVGGQILQLKNLRVDPGEDIGLFNCDGVLGIGDFKRHSIHFNLHKGFFLVTN